MFGFLSTSAASGSLISAASRDINIGEAFFVLFICMLVIMAVQLLLMGMLYGFRYFSAWDKKKHEKTENQPLSLDQTATVSEDEQEIAAVIAAVTAIVMHQKEDNTDSNPVPFKIKNVRRIK